MMRLLLFREQLKSLYGKYERWIGPGLKVLLALTALLLMSQNIGFQSLAANPLVCTAIALFCGVLPWCGVTIVCGVVMLLHLSALSLEIFVGTAAIMMLMFLVYYVFLPGNSLIVLLIPVLFFLRIPYVVPICVGLLYGMTAVIPVTFGVIISYMIRFIQANALVLKDDSALSTLQRFTQMIDYLKTSKALWLMVAVFCIVTVVVYLIRRSSVDRAWQIAIAAGGLIMVIGMIGGIYLLDIAGLSVFWVIAGTIFSVLIAAGFQFFFFAVDYSRTEYTQFEDDEYYYYVKAVPKITVTQPEVTVKKITRQRNKRGESRKDTARSAQEIGRDRTVPEARIFEDNK